MIDLLSGIIALLLDAGKNLAAKTIQGDQLQEGAEYTLNEKTNDISVLEDSLSNCVDAIGSTHQGDDTASKTFALAMIKIWADTSVNSRISKLCGKLYYHFLKLGVPYQRNRNLPRFMCIKDNENLYFLQLRCKSRCGKGYYMLCFIFKK